MGKRHYYIPLAVYLFLIPGSARAAVWHLMDWIDGWYETSTPVTRQQLGVDQVTINCKDLSVRTTPAACIAWIQANTVVGITQFVPYVNPNVAQVQRDALLYSAATVGALVSEVDLDDFFGTYSSWYSSMGANTASFLSQTIDNYRSVNPSLKFGITLYENELDSVANPYIDNTHLPAAVKAKFNVIRLFLHYRANGLNYASYVAQAKAYFPNAQIVAGVYSYDRIDYWPCSQSSSAACTQAQEINYFQQTLNIQVQLLKPGTVVGLDTFPGYFGDETDLYGTGPNSDNLTCNDVTRCVQNTITMRNAILAAYTSFNTTSGGIPPVITQQPGDTSLLVSQTQIFSVTAVGTSPLSYQWRKNGVAIAGATGTSYHTPPVTLADNGSMYVCVVNNSFGAVTSAAGYMSINSLSPTGTTGALPAAPVYPNPWRSDRHAGMPITFSHLLIGSQVKIFTISAHLVKTLIPLTNSVGWDRTNNSGDRVASGLYIYLLTDDLGQTVHGQVAIIK